MINQILATLRKNAGFTQEQLAEKIGVSKRLLYRRWNFTGSIF